MEKIQEILWADAFNADTIQQLQRKIERAVRKYDGAVIHMASPGGSPGAALTFLSWIQDATEIQEKVEVVATGPIASAAIIVFLSFDKRWAKNPAFLHFHKAYDGDSGPNGYSEGSIVWINQKIAEWVAGRTGGKISFGEVLQLTEDGKDGGYITDPDFKKKGIITR